MSPSINMIGSICKSKPFTLCYWHKQNDLESSEKTKKRLRVPLITRYVMTQCRQEYFFCVFFNIVMVSTSEFLHNIQRTESFSKFSFKVLEC